MKRSWREKLAPECANRLDAYHDLKSLVRLDDFNEYVRTQRFSWEETVGEQMLPHRVRFAVRVWNLQRYIPRQRDVAGAIAQQIRLTLNADTRARLASTRPVDP